jgi:hypothetical protein
MKFSEYKIFLKNHPLFTRFEKYDYDFFMNNINQNKPFNNMSYYINKYNLTNDEFNVIHKYTILINNSFTDDDEI